MIYIPIIKSKRGEMVAIGNLEEEILNYIQPIVELVPKTDSTDHRESASRFKECVDKECKKLKHSLIVDFFRHWDDGPDDVITDLFDSLQDYNPIPVVYASTFRERKDLVTDLVNKTDRNAACIRIVPEEITQNLHEILSEIQSTCNIDEGNSILIVDLGVLPQENIGILPAIVEQYLSMVDTIPGWPRRYLASTSMVRDMSEIPRNTTVYIDRIEWNILNRINLDGDLNNIYNYSDYTSVHPDMIEFDVRWAPAAKIRYSAEDSWIISKGRSLRDYGYEQFYILSREVSRLPEYKGREYSFGDNFIAQAAAGEAIGNLTNWVTVSVNHHITLIVDLLSSLDGS